jgi:hypothetical protein
MMSKLTKKGAQAVTADLDRLANLFQTNHKVLGVPARIATDFAYRLDLLSDTIEKKAGLRRTALTGDDVFQESGFDPEAIGMEQDGPLETVDSDEPWMAGEFTAQENRELRELQQAGALGPEVVDGPRAPTPGKQAALARLDAANRNLLRLAKTSPRLAGGLTRLAAQVLNVKAGYLEGQVSMGHVAKTVKAAKLAAEQVEKSEEKEAEEKEPGEEKKVAKLVAMAHRIASNTRKVARVADAYMLLDFMQNSWEHYESVSEAVPQIVKLGFPSTFAKAFLQAWVKNRIGLVPFRQRTKAGAKFIADMASEHGVPIDPDFIVEWG